MPLRLRGRLVAAAASTTACILTAAGLTLVAQGAPSPTAERPTGRDCLAALAAGPAATARQRAVNAAATTFGVPPAVLLGVSYLESRWDDHGAAPSTSGGYGPMHLTDVAVEDMSTGRGDGSVNPSDGPAALHTADVAADLTGLTRGALISHDRANFCGGAALLASYQRDGDKQVGTDTGVASWLGAVRRYSGSVTATDTQTFARQVFTTIKQGEQRVTNDGQHMRLAAQPGLRLPAVSPPDPAKSPQLDCPAILACEWVPAPYEWTDPTHTDPGDYGNHDVANRPADPAIQYIVIHDTEGDWDTAMNLVTDPTYVAWNYTVRSTDGHIAQHLRPKDVGWQAGNWYINSHSIGIEHEGIAAAGATWYTEALYQNSAALVAHLAHEYNIPLDRAHVIGHDQVPGITPAYVAGMHWDPGPYWDWEHYMDLAGAPVQVDSPGDGADWTGRGTYVVAPGFEDNQQQVNGCVEVGVACDPQGTNFVYLHTKPFGSSPLVSDIGLHSDGSASTKEVADIGARLNAGQQIFATGRSRSWVRLWYLGAVAWIHSPKHAAVIFPSDKKTVILAPSADGTTPAPVYGRAYPEESAYPDDIPYQVVEPLQYTIGVGQHYVLADRTVSTDYYYAKTIDNSLPGDHTTVTGQDAYYQIWFGHRIAYVRAADVEVR